MTTEGIAEGSAAEITVTFEVFYTQSWDDVYRAVAVAIGDHDLAAEAVDEAMTRAFERWRSVSVMNNPTGWVYRTAMNWAISRLRRRRLARRHPRPVHDPVVSPTQLDTDLAAALQALPVRQRSVIVARFLLDLSEQQTAEALGIPIGTVKSRTSRALAKLREVLR